MSNYSGEYCILHFDPDTVVDTGRERKPVVIAGFTDNEAVDAENGVFDPPLGAGDFSLSSAQLNDDGSYPDYRAIRVLSDKRELEFSNDSFILDCWINFEILKGEKTICSYGGDSAEAYWWIGMQFGDIPFVPRKETFQFFWYDRFSDRRVLDMNLPVGTFQPNTWYYLVFQYNKESSTFSLWVDGALVASLAGPNAPNLIWDGVYIQNSSAVNGRCLGIGAGPSAATTSRGSPFVGLMDEFRFSYQVAPYESQQATIPVPTERIVDPEPIPDPDNPQPVEIRRPFINGINKLNIEKAKHTPVFCEPKTAKPLRTDGTHEGQLYFYQPEPGYPKIFLYILFNVQGEGETPQYEWMPLSMPNMGQRFPDSGTTWKSRLGTSYGEPF